MASGEVTTIAQDRLPVGWVVTASGRISGVKEPDEPSLTYPFGADTAAGAREILAKVPTPNNAVLLAVSPNQRAIEVVYGNDVKGRGIEESAPLGVSTDCPGMMSWRSRGAPSDSMSVRNARS